MKGINIMRFRFNHNNKGFTLVEMITYIAVLAIVMVEVFVVMSNSSTLYLRGTQEVSLQTEAQELILQMEDLLVDCTSVNTVHVDSISSDSLITISTNGVKYEIAFDKVDPAEPYGKLFLNITDIGGSGSLVMAEHVNIISCNMANYVENNIVTLYVTMQNDRYSYTTTKDVFLRNMPGTGAKKRGKDSNMKKEVGFEVLRFGEYDIKDVCFSEINDYCDLKGKTTSDFTFSIEWSDDTKNTKDGDNKTAEDYYTLNGSKIGTGSTINMSHNKEYGYDTDYILKLYATDAAGVKDEVCELKITTPKLFVGIGALGTDGKNGASSSGYALIFPSDNNDSPYRSAIDVDGINMHKLSEIKVQTLMVDVNDIDNSVVLDEKTKTGITGGFEDKAFMGAKNFGNTQMANGTPIGNLVSGYGMDSFQYNGVGIGTDPFSGCILVYTRRFFNGNMFAYKEYMENGYILDVRVIATFKDGSDDVTVTFDNFCYPASKQLQAGNPYAWPSAIPGLSNDDYNTFVNTIFTQMKKVSK